MLIEICLYKFRMQIYAYLFKLTTFFSRFDKIVAEYDITRDVFQGVWRKVSIFRRFPGGSFGSFSPQRLLFS